MTKEEIAALKSRVEAFCPKPASADQIHLHVLKALDALEEAHKEIERLKVRVCSLHCSDDAKSEDHERGCPFYIGTYA